MADRKGKIKVDTSHIFPIIKKWLYSEHDIFLRELVANATDAISKRAALARIQNEKIPAGEIRILVDQGTKTIVVSDNGLGMTEERSGKVYRPTCLFGVQRNLLRISKRPAVMKKISSENSVWDFTPLLWPLRKCE